MVNRFIYLLEVSDLHEIMVKRNRVGTTRYKATLLIASGKSPANAENHIPPTNK
jgi:hypothetical protein